MKQDEEHLRLLSIFHYIVAGLMGLVATFPVIHLIVGIVFIFTPQIIDGPSEPPPAFIGWFFVIIALTFIFIGWACAVCVFLAGRFIARRKHHTFCLVIAGIECLFMPFGTVLGVFTIIVLMRESVKDLFATTPCAQRVE